MWSQFWGQRVDEFVVPVYSVGFKAGAKDRKSYGR